MVVAKQHKNKYLVDLESRACSNIVGWGTMLKSEDHGFESKWGSWIVSIDIILPAALDPEVYSVCSI
jgi:hypothetical protein